jgi:hypothetical protein
MNCWFPQIPVPRITASAAASRASHQMYAGATSLKISGLDCVRRWLWEALYAQISLSRTYRAEDCDWHSRVLCRSVAEGARIIAAPAECVAISCHTASMVNTRVR